MKRLELSLLIGIALSILLASLGSFGAQAQEIRGEVLRLHVLANSDSEQDQALKLAVRDALLQETQELFTAAEGREQAERMVLEDLDRLEEIAREVLLRQGFDYPVQVRLVNMYFGTRQYEAATLAAGRYDAVRVEIGEGAGQNWWCVMFPPMCIPAASEGNGLTLEEEIRELSAQPSYIPKFAVVELIESVHNRVRGGEREIDRLPGEAQAEGQPEGGEDAASHASD